MLHPDARIPVVFGKMTDLQPSDVLIRTSDMPVELRQTPQLVLNLDPIHAPGCACCMGRDPWADALNALFIAMMRGDRPSFDRLLAVLDGPGAARLHNLLAQDRIVAARYRAGSIRVLKDGH